MCFLPSVLPLMPPGTSFSLDADWGGVGKEEKEGEYLLEQLWM